MWPYMLYSFYHRLVEEADYRATAELFGVKDDDKNLDMFIPKSESDFLEYAEMISHRIKPYEVCCILPYIPLFSLASIEAHDVWKYSLVSVAEKLSLYSAAQNNHETFIDQHESSWC